MIKQKQLITSIILTVAIIIVANLLSENYFFRLDLTQNNRYTLSEATNNILGNLDEPVTVKAYFSEDLPPQVARGKRDFKELLIEYAARSGDMVVYEFINPTDDQTRRGAMRKGIRPIMINVEGKDEMKQKRAYMGAVIKKGGQEETIPFIKPGMAMEYELSKAIKKISVQDKPAIAIMQGHGEPSLRKMQQVRKELEVLYQPEAYSMTDTTRIPQRFEAIAIVSPRDSFPQSHLQQMDNYLQNGGRMLIAADRVNGNLQRAFASKVQTNFYDWLAGKGVVVKDQFLYDRNAASVSVQSQQSGGFSFMNQVTFPYIPIIKNFSDHPVTKGIEQMLYKFGSPLEYKGDTSIQHKPIAFSSKNAGTQAPPFRFNVSKKWTQNDFNQARIPIAMALEGQIGGNSYSKMVVFGDGDFPVSERRQNNPGQVSLFVNSIDWLADDTGLTALRTKQVTSRPIKEVEPGKQDLLKYLNFLLPIVLVLLYGFVHYQMNRNTRIKRMEESYA